MTFDQLFDRVSPHGEAEIVIGRDGEGVWHAAVDSLTIGDSLYEVTGDTPEEAFAQLAQVVAMEAEE